MVKVSERLKLLRDEKGLSQEKLGSVLGIPRGTIAAWETGDRIPEAETLVKLADYFGMYVDYLLGRIDVRNPVSTEAEAYRLYEAVQDDAGLIGYLEKFSSHDGLKLLAKQVKDLPQESITRIIRVIKAIEE